MRLVPVALLLAAISTTAVAQQKGAHRGFLIGGTDLGGRSAWSLQLDSSGMPVATLRTGSSYPTWGNVYGQTIDADNKTVIVPGILSSSRIGLMKYDPGARAIVGTIWAGPRSAATLIDWTNLTLDSDGDIITIDDTRVPKTLAKYDRWTQSWSHYPLPVDTSAGAGLAGCEWDALRGGFNHAAIGFLSASPTRLYNTSYDGSVTRTVASHTVGSEARLGGTRVDNGDWISSTCCIHQYYIVKAGSATWTRGPIAPFVTVSYDVTHEKYAAPGQGVFTANVYPRGARYIDLNSGAVTTVYRGTSATWPDDALEITPLWSRDVGTMRTSECTWDVDFGPGNGLHAGENAVAVCSLAAPGPGGIPLMDGREIHIGFPDPAVFLTLNDLAAPYLTGQKGVLDNNGQRVAKLDLELLKQTANGIVLHFCAVVLRGNTILWVCEPHAFVIDVLDHTKCP